MGKVGIKCRRQGDEQPKTAHHILVVEDNEKNRKLVRSLLKIHHYEVSEAADAETGIEMAKNCPPDLILMDIQLPGMDGLEAAKSIKNTPALKNINIVALTSYAMDGDSEKAMAAGCNGYITKPINTRHFIDQISPFLPHSKCVEASELNDHGATTTSNAPMLLIVDDEPMNLKLLRAKLKKDYSHIIEAVDGIGALKKAEENIPDLILLDIMMPGLDGFEVTRRLKANPKTKNIPIILITALDGHDYKVMGFEAGADEFLNKPINTCELLTRSKSLLQMKQYQDRLSSESEKSKGTINAYPVEGYSAYPDQKIQILVDGTEQSKQIQMYLFGQGYNIEINDRIFHAADPKPGDLPDVLILDNNYQSANSLALCRDIKENEETGNCQVLYVTTEDDLEMNYPKFEDCIDDFLTQPINIYELRARIRVLLKKKLFLDKLFQGNSADIQHVIIDQLTGLYNLEYCVHVLKHEIQRSVREKSSVALVMMEVSQSLVSKSPIGHAAGDPFFLEMGTLIKKSIRKLDIAARRSERTFAFVLPETDNRKTQGFINRLRGVIDSQLSVVQSSEYSADSLFSFGYAVCPNDSNRLDELLEIADSKIGNEKCLSPDTMSNK